ncbi:ATP-binding protein [Streptomyces sp. NPDC006660]|uniref:ATP-binding protein n=1 Tax=Streptomyces sp. NPDC006660 TaxID=3156901 RepID=UPI0033F25355
MKEETAQGVREFSVQLSCTRRGARLARILLVEQLRRWGREFEDAQHVVAELASNAVLHGRVPGRDMRLVLRDTPGALRIEMVDARGDRLPVARAEPWAESGRGLLLVAAYATRWGVLTGPGPCKTVWAELPARSGNGAGGGGAPPYAESGEGAVRPSHGHRAAPADR